MSATKNDVTGDQITTKVPNDNYREGWDRIFNQSPEKDQQTNTDCVDDKEHQ